ncbi:MAG TPA: hypothetical protein VFY40_19080 [Blastocatellia bacterium]|nr:hypothetical protein [Blastocatellia bacterium]
MAPRKAYYQGPDDDGKARRRGSNDADKTFRGSPIGGGKKGSQDAGAPRREIIH